MMSQGVEPHIAPNSKRAEVVDGGQGHAPVNLSLNPAPQSWSSSTGTSTIPSSGYSYHPQNQPSFTGNTQSGINSSSHAFASSTLGAASAPQDYSIYSSYSSSTVPYNYTTPEYQNIYYGYAQPVSQSPSQQVGANSNSGAAYQPLSSFQNSGSYVNPPSYLGTYYNTGDTQSTAAYGNNNYNYQNSMWNDGSHGTYSTHHYASYTPTDPVSTQSSASNSLYHPQQYNQWPYYFNQSAPVANGAPGTENASAIGASAAGYSAAAPIGGFPYSSNQPPPPGTTSWRKDSGSSVTASQEIGAAYQCAKGLEPSSPASQNQNMNQPLYFQIPQNSALPHENRENEQKVMYSNTPSLQHSCSSQVPQNFQPPLHSIVPTDVRQVSRVQIPVNPRIASNTGLGTAKVQKESFSPTVAVKPAYLSVSLPKPNDKSSSEDDSQSICKGTLPASLRAYVERSFARCKDDAQRSANQNTMKEIITRATADGTLFTKNWDIEPLFPLTNTTSDALLQSNLVSFPSLTKEQKTSGRRTKSRWEPVVEEKIGERIPPVVAEASGNVSNINGWKGIKFIPQQQAPSNNFTPRAAKKQRLTDSNENGDASSDSEKDQGFTKYRVSAFAVDSPEEKKRREQRFKRFEKGQGNRAGTSHFRPKTSISRNLYAKRASDMLLVRGYGDGSGTTVEDIDWDSLTVKGTCQEIEKRYLRLTSAPDPSTVRPEEVLEKALKMVQTSTKNYLYKCDQLKSIRQDLTVQRIQNAFTVQVYETHARLALEAGDLPEFNQCQSQLKRLYAEGIPGCHYEFAAYNLLCVILHSNNKRDSLSSMRRLSKEAKNDEAVKHALAVQSAVSSGNYVLFFRLYNAAPNLNTCLMDLYLEKLRFEALTCMCKAYRPLVPVTYISQVLGFSKAVKLEDCKDSELDGTNECQEWLRAHGAVLVADNNGELHLDAKVSSSNLYMPEPDDAVAHGDANLAVDDFLARAP